MSGPGGKPPGPVRSKPSLIAAAQASSSSAPPQPPPPRPSTSQPVDSQTISDRSTPTFPDSGSANGGAVQKMKFKPKLPTRRVKHEADVKPDISTLPPVRGTARGRGRGMARGRGASQSTSIAAGVFGGSRAAHIPVKRAHTTGAPGYADSDAEVYSDHSDSGKGGIIDIDAVSGQGESAPTSLHRDRKLGENVRGKGKAKAEGEEGQVKQSRSGRDVEKKVRKPRVKDEPLSPLNRDKDLEGLNGGVPPPVGREDDEMMSGDEEQDLDHEGRSVRAFARTGGNDEEGEEVNEAQKVDLSESESEEEEEGMEGDFVQSDGHADPNDKLFVFQFPTVFPKFVPSGPIDVSQDDNKPDVAKDIKPTAAQLRSQRKKEAVVPQGKVGTMVVMKSGRVKIVLGDNIVMNVTPGVPTTFLQHLVHLDIPNKSAVVPGEVHKQYVVTPDIDRLLDELYIQGGKTPGEKESEKRKAMVDVKREKTLVKMEVE